MASRLRFLLLHSMFAAFLGAASGSSDAACAHPESQFEAKDCLYGGLQRAEADLRRAMQQTEKAISQDERTENRPAARRALALAQRSWRIWRDRDCAAEVALDAGDGNVGMNETQCRINLTRERIKRLQDFR